MNYPKLTSLLGLASIVFHNSIFGGKTHARLDEEQLQAVEAALAENDTTALTEKISQLEADNSALQSKEVEMQNALEEAFEKNGLTIAEGATVVDAIAQLATFKANATHEIPSNNGEEAPSGNGLVDGYVDPNAAHNKLLNQISK